MVDRWSDAYREGCQDFERKGRLGYDRDRYDGYAWREDENYTVGFDTAKGNYEYEERQRQEREEREVEERRVQKAREKQWEYERQLEEERLCEQAMHEQMEQEAMERDREPEIED